MQSKLTDGYKSIFYNSQSPMLIIDVDAPAYTMLDVNNAYLETTHTTRADIIGKPVFGVFPGNPTDAVSKNIERTIFSFEQAIKNKVPHVMSNYRYDIPIPGTDAFEERYWTTSNTPVLDDNGKVIYFIHSPLNVTELNLLAEREKAGVQALKEQREQLYSTFMQAPVGIAIFKGPAYTVDLINPSLCEIYGKNMDEFLGRGIFDALPEAKGRGFEELLDSVRLTGIPYRGIGLTAPIMRKGELVTVHFDFVYEPFRETDGTISGVIAVATEITEQVNAKIKLEEAEQRARLAVDSVGLGTFDLDLSTREMITSEKVAHIFGFDHIVSRKEYVAVFHPDDLELRRAAHEEAIHTGQLRYEARVIWSDTSVHWVRIEGKTFYEAAKPLRILGIVRDITAQRNAKEEERKLISLVENSVDLMSILSMEGVNSYINEAGMKLLGFDNAGQVKSFPIAELHTPEDFKKVETEVLPSVMATGKWSGIMQVRHIKTKEVFPVLNNCFRIDDPELGIPIAVGAVMRDLRPENAAKKALSDSEALLKNITTAAPTSLWMSDEHGAITYVNQTWLDWTGAGPDDSLGDAWLSSIYAEDRNKTGLVFQTALDTRSFYEAEFRLHHSDGTLHWCVATGKPQYGKNGAFSGYVGACVDITEQKHLQQQKDDFIGIASHELKTPVTSIKGYTQVLEKMLEQKGHTTEATMMGRMNTQINRLTHLIGDLLDVTKINSGRLQFNEGDFDFYSLVKELVEDMQRTTEKHTLIERYEGEGIVFGDRERIGQVITNLISNAIKYSPYADSIIVSAVAEQEEFLFTVQDFGIGIPPDKLSKVFEQFFRVDGDVQHTFPGMGLGLYISSEIIQRAGGRIWATSIEGEGSTFCFVLPKKSTTDP